jgi:hypothetical protein
MTIDRFVLALLLTGYIVPALVFEEVTWWQRLVTSTVVTNGRCRACSRDSGPVDRRTRT